MGRLNLDDLEAGMVLAEAVQNRDGQVLLTAGAVLTSKHLRLFKIWGIRQFEIEGAGGETPEQIETELRLHPALKRANDEVDERFRYVQQDRMMMKIKEEIKRYLHLQYGRKHAD